MFRFSIFLSALLLVVSCKHVQQKEVYTDEPVLLPIEQYSANSFTEPFFSEQHFGFTEFMKYDSSGKLVYRYPAVLNNNYIDTTKYYHSAEVIVLIDTAKHYFRNCTATKSGDTITLSFTDNPFARSHFELKTQKIKESVVVQYRQSFSITDSSYKPPVYSVAEQSLLTDRKDYEKGDSIKAKIHVTIIGHHSWPTDYRDTTRVYGMIKTVVE